MKDTDFPAWKAQCDINKKIHPWVVRNHELILIRLTVPELKRCSCVGGTIRVDVSVSGHLYCCGCRKSLEAPSRGKDLVGYYAVPD